MTGKESERRGEQAHRVTNFEPKYDSVCSERITTKVVCSCLVSQIRGIDRNHRETAGIGLLNERRPLNQ